MSDDWEQRDRAGSLRKIAVPLAFVVVGLAAALLAGPRPTSPPFSVMAEERPGTPEATPAAAPDEPGGRWQAVDAGPLSARDRAVVVWADDQVIVWGGRSPLSPHPRSDGATFDPATGAWVRLPPAPLGGRVGAAAAWTGSELIIWGGTADGRALDDGAAYNPSTRRWRRLAAAPLSARWDATAVHVAGKVVVWGGRGVGARHPRSDGAIYDPDKDSWRRLPRGPLTGGGASSETAVAVDDDVLIWSASRHASQLAAYHLPTRSWRTVATPRLQTDGPPPLLSLEGSVLAWGTWTMGDKGPLAMSFTTEPDWWTTVARPPFAPDAGRTLHGGNGMAASWSAEEGGVFFNALANTWTPMSAAPGPDGLGWPAQVWAGDRLFVWHGQAKPSAERRALIWQPPDPWERVEGSPVPIGEKTTALWSGWLRDQQQVLVWGGQSVGRPNTGAALDPELRLWETIPAGPLSIRNDAALLWAGDEMVALGGRDGRGRARRDGAAYQPSSRSWRALPPAPVPISRGAAAWSGERLFAAGLRGGEVVVASTAPGARRWRAVPSPPLKSATTLQVLWTGLDLWVVDTGSSRVTGAAWDPARRVWRRLPPLPRVSPPAEVVWTGRRMYLVDAAGDTASLGLTISTWLLHPPSGLRGEGVAIEWTGRRLVAYLPASRQLRFLDPRGAAWAVGTPPPFEPSPAADLVWTGRQLFAIGAGGVAELGGGDP